jgi:putative membrane protein
MAFIDNLAYGLFSISFASFLLLYTVISMYLVYRRGNRKYSDYLNSASVPLLLIGLYMIVQALWGQFTWPLPGSYNVLFYDPLLSFGLLLVGFFFAVRYKVRLEYVGFFGLLVGIMVIIYGIQGYNIGLTSQPLAMLGMYILYGLSGLVAYPVALIADRLPGHSKNVWIGWYLFLALFCILLLLAGLLSAGVGYAAVSQHLINPP